MNRKTPRLLLLAFLLTAEIVAADKIAIVNEKAPAVIPLGQTRQFQFGTVPQANTTILLKIKSRMDLPGGGFALHMGQSVYRFTSSLSFPNAGFNRLTAGAPVSGGQKTWKMSTEGNRVTGEGPDYRVVRTVSFGPRRVEIADVITTTTRTCRWVCRCDMKLT